jgi:hypothetical protein
LCHVQSNRVSAKESAYRAVLRERDERIAILEAEKASREAASSVADGKSASTGDMVQDWITSLE